MKSEIPGRNGHGAMPPRNWLRAVTAADLPQLEALTREDKHSLVSPSHVMLKDGEIAGYFSIGTLPLVLPWFHSERCKARDSKYFINVMENFLANAMAKDHDLICVPVPLASPFHPHIAGLGYTPVCDATITLKKVR